MVGSLFILACCSCRSLSLLAECCGLCFLNLTLARSGFEVDLLGGNDEPSPLGLSSLDDLCL